MKNISKFLAAFGLMISAMFLCSIPAHAQTPVMWMPAILTEEFRAPGQNENTVVSTQKVVLSSSADTVLPLPFWLQKKCVVSSPKQDGSSLTRLVLCMNSQEASGTGVSCSDSIRKDISVLTVLQPSPTGMRVFSITLGCLKP